MVPEWWLSLMHVSVIGNTGVGKSALCNYLSGKQDGSHMSFPVSEKIDAFTNKTTVQVEKWLGTGDEFVLVDTPGLGDPSGKDSLHIAEMVKELKQLEYINSFLILFNAQNPRLDESLRAMVDIFTQIFGRERFFDNVILVFTRWEHSARAERKRQRTGESRLSREREFNGYFRKAFDVKHSLPALFIDAYPDPEDEAEIRANVQEVVQLKDITEKLLPFPLEDAEIVRGYMDQLKDKIEEETGRANEAEEEAKRNAEKVEEEKEGREQDRIQFEIDMKTKEEEHKERIDKMDKEMQKAREIWERDRQEYERRQRELAERLRRRKKKKGWGISLGPVHIEL